MTQAIKDLQKFLNDHGAKLTVDGEFGPYTESALAAFLKFQSAPAPMPPSGKTPWRDWFLARKGWTEFNHDKELSKGWPIVGLAQFHTVIGKAHAWCGMSLATALHEDGFAIPHGAAGAANWDHYGTPIAWKTEGIPQGAIVRIRHKDGGAHVTTADRDHKPGEDILDALGGNQGDSIKVSRFDVSGNAHGHDEIVYVGWPVKV